MSIAQHTIAMFLALTVFVTFLCGLSGIIIVKHKTLESFKPIHIIIYVWLFIMSFVVLITVLQFLERLRWSTM